MLTSQTVIASKSRFALRRGDFCLSNDFLFCFLVLRLFSLFLIAALQSVFPLTEMNTFISLSKKDKEQQLRNLAMLVTGIRLYNKERGKGGSSIDDCKQTPAFGLCIPSYFFLTFTGVAAVVSHLSR